MQGNDSVSNESRPLDDVMKSMGDDPAKIDLGRLQSLYRKAFAVLRLAPWRWLRPRDYFGIVPEEGAEPVFFHFRPVGEEDFEIILAFGWEADAKLLRIFANAVDHPEMAVLELPLVGCRLSKLSEIQHYNRVLFGMTGLKPDEMGRAPVFTCYRPGWLPWVLQNQDVTRCERLFDQALGVLLRAESDTSMIRRERPDSIWLRVLDANREWREGWFPLRAVQERPLKKFQLPSSELIDKVNALPVAIDSVEIDIGILDRLPFLNPKKLLESSNGLVPVSYFLAMCDTAPEVQPGKSCISDCVMYAGGNVSQMWGEVPKSVLEFMIEAGRRPRQILVSSNRMMDVLRPLQTKIRFKLTYHQSLPNFEAVLERANEVISRILRERKAQAEAVLGKTDHKEDE